MRPLFITIDTEGDALWDDPAIDEIKTENTLWIPKFQELCEKYGFIPIWLTDYEIISDERFVNYIKNKNHAGLCEVGIHVHARNNPPLCQLENEKEKGAAYLIEYPKDIMREKFFFLKKLIEERLECKVITHRAGRWTIDKDYIDILVEAGIKYDCTVTPGLTWSGCEGITPGSKGSDYTDKVYKRQLLKGRTGEIVEYPMTILKTGSFIFPSNLTFKSCARACRNYLKKIPIWLRPNTNRNLNEMKYILDTINKNEYEYAEFMIHSSEFMPGGGPKHQGKQEVDKLFEDIENLFIYAKSIGYEGCTFETWEGRKLEEWNAKK